MVRGKIFSIEQGPDDEITFTFRQPKFEFTLTAREHLRSASKETLLAFRSLIDDALKNIEKKEKKPEKKQTKIEVE